MKRRRIHVADVKHRGRVVRRVGFNCRSDRNGGDAVRVKGEPVNKSQQDAEALAEHVEVIRTLGKQNIENVIEIGRRLILCKEIVKKSAGSGNWLEWVNREFAWSTRQAQNMMKLAEMAAKNAKFAFSDMPIPLSAWYRLAAPSTPQEVQDKVFALASQARMTHAQITAIIGRGIVGGVGRRRKINLEEDESRWGEKQQEDWVKCIRFKTNSAIQAATLDNYGHPQWPSYEVPAELVELAREAAERWNEVAKVLDEQHRRTDQVEEAKAA
jgi:Protein of unknown function (DUF3102)